MLTDDQKNAISPILGRVPSGVFILVAGNADNKKTGLLASWVQQASFDPPQVTVAVNKSRYLNDWLGEGSPVTLNQVSQDDKVLFRHFGKGFEPDADAFAGVSYSAGDNGLPVLTDGMASMEGKVVSAMEAADHVVYLVEITNAIAHQAADEFNPFVHVRKNGFNY